MKKYLLLAFLLFVPFLTNAQQIPELYITDLLIEKTDYQLGETINGSFTLHNVSDFDATDVYYYLSIGEISENGLSVYVEADRSDFDGPYLLRPNSKQNIEFSYIPQKTIEGDLGIQLKIQRKDGALLSFDAEPITLTGETVDLLKGFLFAGDNMFSLDSGPTTQPDSEMYLIVDSENLSEGDTVKVEIYDRTFIFSNLVFTFDPVLEKVETFDGEYLGFVLPKDLLPNVYVGKVYADNTSVLQFKYIVSGVQAEILNIVSSNLSPQKGENFELNISYGGGPTDFLTPGLNPNPEKVRFEITVFNQKDEIVAQINEVKDVPKETLDNGELLNVFNEVFLLTSNADAYSLNFDVKLFDEISGELLDEYGTTFPPQLETETSNTLLYTIIALVFLILLFALFKKLKTSKKIQIVCLALLFTSVSVYALVTQSNDADALQLMRSGSIGNGELKLAFPATPEVRTYGAGDSISLSGWYDISVCSNNGWVNAFITVPSSNNWHSFKTAKEASDHIWSNKIDQRLTFGSFQTFESVAEAKKDIPSGGVFWYAVPINQKFPNAGKTIWYRTQKSNSHYTTLIKDATATKYWDNKELYFSTQITMPSSAGTYYVPILVNYCTTSHGCSDQAAKVFVQPVQVSGSGTGGGGTTTTTQSTTYTSNASCTTNFTGTGTNPKVGEEVIFTGTYAVTPTNYRSRGYNLDDLRFYWLDSERVPPEEDIPPQPIIRDYPGRFSDYMAALREWNKLYYDPHVINGWFKSDGGDTYTRTFDTAGSKIISVKGVTDDFAVRQATCRITIDEDDIRETAPDMTCSPDDESPGVGQIVTFTASVTSPADPDDVRYYWGDNIFPSENTQIISVQQGKNEIQVRAESGSESYGPVNCSVDSGGDGGGPSCNAWFAGTTRSNLLGASNLCSSGTISNFQRVGYGWTWICTKPGYFNVRCSAFKSGGGGGDDPGTETPPTDGDPGFPEGIDIKIQPNINPNCVIEFIDTNLLSDSQICTLTIPGGSSGTVTKDVSGKKENNFFSSGESWPVGLYTLTCGEGSNSIIKTDTCRTNPGTIAD